MQFTYALLTLAAVVYAAPSGNSFTPVPSSTTMRQAGDACGTDMELNCCNKVSKQGNTVNAASGVLAGLGGNALQNVALFDGCSKLNIPIAGVGAGITDLLNSQCKQTAACCQHSGTNQNGLVNVGLPCVALGGLL